MRKVLLGVFMSSTAAAAIAVITVGIGVSAADYVQLSAPRMYVVVARRSASPVAAVPQQPCVSKSSAATVPVGGLGNEKIPRLPGASRTNYDGNGVSQYSVRAASTAVLQYYAGELAARCWQVAAISDGQAVWTKDGASLKIGVAEDRLGGASTVNYQLAYGQVLGVSTFQMAQTSCAEGQVYCPDPCGSGTGGCSPSGTTCMTTCPSGSTTSSCPTPPSGCTSGYTYNSQGCATGCMASTQSCSGSYTQGTATYSCNYSTCPNGCTYDSTGCANGCTASSCTGAYTSGVPWSCTNCSGSCSYDSTGCATTCNASTGGTTGGTTCTGEMFWCPSSNTCIANSTPCAPTSGGTPYCGGGYTYCSSNYSCLGPGVSCPSGTTGGTTAGSCTGGQIWCASSSGTGGWCQMAPCPVTCASGQISCWDSSGSQYCYTGTYCPATGGGGTTAGSCTGGQIWCPSSSGGTGWCQMAPCPTPCPSGQYWCQFSSTCKPNADTNCSVGGTTACGSGQISCWNSSGSQYCYTGTTCPATGGTGGPTSCTSPQVLCTGSGGYSWCQSSPCPQTCPSGQYSCNGVCKPTSDTYCPSLSSNCASGTYWCNGSCIPSSSTCNMPGGMGCSSTTYWCSTTNSCIPFSQNCSGSTTGGGSTYPGNESSCPGFSYSRFDAQGRRYCQLNNERRCDYNYPSYLTNGANYTAVNCPAETGGGSLTCGSGQISCGSSTGSPYCYTGTTCPSTGGSTWPTTSADCTARGYKWCQGTNSGACYFAGQTCPQSCPSGQYWCSSSGTCKPNSDTNCSPGGSTPTCSSGQRWCWTTTSCVANDGFCADGATCPSNQFWCGTTQRCQTYSESCSSGGTTGGVTTCPAGQNRCTGQSGGSWCQSGACPLTCQSNEFFCPSSNTCKKYGEDCPPTSGCSGGMVWCPANYSCQAPGTPCESGCPRGYYKCWAENGVCKPDNSSCGSSGGGTCPTGTSYCYGSCTSSTQPCYAPQPDQGCQAGTRWCQTTASCIASSAECPAPQVGPSCVYPKYFCDNVCVAPGTPCRGIVPPSGDGRDTGYRPPQQCERGTYFCPSRGASGECISYSEPCVVYRGEVRQYPNQPGGPYPGGPFGDGQYPADYQVPNLSQEQVSQIEHRQFAQAVSRLPDFEKEFATAKRQFKQMESKLKSCKFEMPKPLVEALAAFERTLPKLKAATEFSEVEATMREIWFDAGPEMERWAEQMPELLRQCELKKRERRIRNDVRAIERDFGTLKRRAGKREEFTELVADAEAKVVALKATTEAFFTVLGKDIDAAGETSDLLWDDIENARIANDTLRGALNARSELSRMDRELRQRKTEIDRFAKAGKDVTAVRAAYNAAKAKVDEVRTAVRERADIETIVDLMTELPDFWDELMATLEELRGYGAYEMNIEIKDRIDFELTDGFKPLEYELPVSGTPPAASSGGTPTAAISPAPVPSPLPSPSPSPTPSCPVCQAWNVSKQACAVTPFVVVDQKTNKWCDGYGAAITLSAGKSFVSKTVNGEVRAEICGDNICQQDIEDSTNCAKDCAIQRFQY